MIDKIVSQVGSGMVSGIEYHYKHYSNQNMSPTFLAYQITDGCNSKCQMCNIWQKTPKNELSSAEIEEIFSSRLFSKLRWMNLTGGEPFVRNDIFEIIQILNKLPKLEGIAIPTNGFLTKRILDIVEKSLKILGKKKFLSVTLSIDGFEKTHDEIRGVPGAYQKVMKTLDGLLKLKKKYKNFNVGVQPTISKKNIEEIEDFYNFIKKEKTENIGFAVTMSSDGYYGNTGTKLELDKKDKKKVAKFFKQIINNDPQYAYYYLKLIEMFKTNKRNFLCLGGFLSLFMNPKGDLSPCPILSEDKDFNFGNGNSNAHYAWFSKRATKIKKHLKHESACKKCQMMCDFINVAKVEFYSFAGFMITHPVIFTKFMKKITDSNSAYL
jgi:MoaA/NifB/PqqE/SkfB family radical SAM enzyme